MPLARLTAAIALPASLCAFLCASPAAAAPAETPVRPAASAAVRDFTVPPAWAFRGILAGEEVPAVFLVLHGEMSLAYDLRGGSLLLAWKGKPVPEAPSAGPSPAESLPRYRAEGPAYRRRTAARPWSATGPKGNLPVSVAFAGIAAEGDLASLAWRLSLPGGRIVRVKEVPMFDDHYGDPGIFRNFTVTGLPRGTSLRLSLAGRGMAETWGGGGEGGLAGEGDSLAFVQDHDGETPLKATWSPAPDAPGEPAPRTPPPPRP